MFLIRKLIGSRKPWLRNGHGDVSSCHAGMLWRVDSGCEIAQEKQKSEEGYGKDSGYDQLVHETPSDGKT
ncbi:MAG: hypothetical protein P4L10_09235 [Acidobacteriaceae bacterium]|nr:hypothetical protein [Acidobacteriaceae bacterium]